MKSKISTLIAVLSALSLTAKPLEIWISSYTDKVYYESMAELYRNEVDKSFEANVTAYGFAEMPDKLTVAIKTRTGGPDIVQLDEIFYGAFLGDKGTPFVDLTDRVKKAELDKNYILNDCLFYLEGPYLCTSAVTECNDALLPQGYVSGF